MILWLHIAGGVLTMGVAGLVALRACMNRHTTLGRNLLPGLAIWQVVSGFLLILTGGSLLRVCGMGLVYLSVVSFVYIWSGREITQPVHVRRSSK